jgi:hypothetical protein
VAYKTNISIGAPPILWSNVQQAFDEINQNFLELGVVVGSALDLEPLNFNNLESSVSPNNSNEFNLGSASKTWKSLYVAEWFDIPGNQFNGVWLGDAQIKGTGTTVDLPASSTVDGELIINPAHTSFKTISIPTQSDIVADSFTDTLNITSTIGISLTTNAGTDTLTIGNSGVRSIQGSTYIGVSAPTGDNITLTNQGVTNLTAGAGIQIDNPTGSIEITNTGIRGITPGGGGITVFIDPSTRIASIGNTAPVTRSFATIRVPGQADLEADITSDILQIHPGYGISLTTSEPIGESERLTISFDNNVDIVGSVFADNSSILVDAVDGTIYGNVRATTLRTEDTKIALGSGTAVTAQGARSIAIGQSSGQSTQGTDAVAIGQYAGNEVQGNNSIAVGNNAGYTGQGSIAVAIGQNAGETSQGSAGVAIGYYAGKTTQETGAVAIGYTTAQITQRTGAVAVGWSAGQTNQGAYSIAIGYRAGFTNQNASSIVLNASGAALEAAAAGLFVNPVRSISNGKPLMYDTATSELAYSSALEFNGTTISTADSSAVQFDGPVTFQGIVSIEGDLRIRNDLVLDQRLTLAELEGVNNELNIYSDWARDTGISIYSAPGVESVTLTSNRIVGVVTGVGPTQKEWVFDTNGQIQFPDTRYQTGAAISIAELKVLVAAAGSYAAFQSAIAALA